jgi:3alpha(or 20beta)-hydroxysteroid dehydrogenase
MSGRLDGRVVVVTGGGRGQGEAESRLFSAEGATVVLTDVLVDAGQAVADDIGGTFIAHDVSSAADWDRVMARVRDQHGRLDGLVNNAAIYERARLIDTSEDLFRRTLDVNTVGVYLGMKAAAPLMIDGGGGSIVNISSGAGLRATPGAFAYSASKWAVTGMTQTAAVELGEYGIRVNSIHPGFIDTAMLPDNEAVKTNMAKIVPLGRIAEPREVANLALYLLSDESSYSTGAPFIVDGGIIA